MNFYRYFWIFLFTINFSLFSQSIDSNFTLVIDPGHGGKDILKHDVINDITDLWNANCPDPKYKKVALRGFYLSTDEVITKGIV